MRLNRPDLVRAEYATEAGLEGRRAAYRYADGPDPREVAFQAVAEATPRRMLEVGCGPGEFAARVQAELGASVTAVDLSPRMVELARRRGVDARVGDVQELPFGDGEFDCAVAAWMLYHVPDLDRGLAEVARVLRPGGRLVAVTNHLDHLLELRRLLGVGDRAATPFSGENGGALLARRFDRVEAREAAGTVRFPDRDAVVAYVEASRALSEGPRQLPGTIDVPFVVRRRPVGFVAEKG